MDRFIDSIEWIAAVFVGIVALDVFVSILLRYFFSYQIPDSYSIGQLLLGILIFWGIAATSYLGTHITVDLIYANINPIWQRVMDVFFSIPTKGSMASSRQNSKTSRTNSSHFGDPAACKETHG